MPKDKDSRQIFSISKRYEDVFNILESIPNKSAFICEAILAYNKSGKNSKDDTSHIEEIVKKEVEKALQSLIEENMFIVKGNPGLVIQAKETNDSPALELDEPSEKQKHIEYIQEPEPSQEDDEEYDLIMSISNQW